MFLSIIELVKVLSVFWIQALFQILEIVLSQACLFVFIIVSFEEQKCIILMKFKWLFIVLLLLTDCFFLMLWFLDNKYWPIQRLQGYFARFYSTSFVELLFVFNMWFISNYLSVLVWYRKKSSLLSIKIYIWSSIISQKSICFPRNYHVTHM